MECPVKMKPLTSFFKLSGSKLKKDQQSEVSKPAYGIKSKEADKVEEISDDAVKIICEMSYEDFLQQTDEHDEKKTEKQVDVESEEQLEPNAANDEANHEESSGDCSVVEAQKGDVPPVNAEESMETDDVVVCDGQSYEDFLRENATEDDAKDDPETSKKPPKESKPQEGENPGSEFTQLKSLKSNCKKTVLDFFGKVSKEEVLEKRRKEKEASRRKEVKVQAQVHTFDIFDRSARKSGCEAKLKLQKKNAKNNNNKLNVKAASNHVFDSSITVLDAQSSLYKETNEVKAAGGEERINEEEGSEQTIASEDSAPQRTTAHSEKDQEEESVPVDCDNDVTIVDDDQECSTEAADHKQEESPAKADDETRLKASTDCEKSTMVATPPQPSSASCFSLFQPKVFQS